MMNYMKHFGYDTVFHQTLLKQFEVLATLKFNISLHYRVFPDKLKTACVTPILKNGDNYGPISVLPCFSTSL